MLSAIWSHRRPQTLPTRTTLGALIPYESSWSEFRDHAECECARLPRSIWHSAVPSHGPYHKRWRIAIRKQHHRQALAVIGGIASTPGYELSGSSKSRTSMTCNASTSSNNPRNGVSGDNITRYALHQVRSYASLLRALSGLPVFPPHFSFSFPFFPSSLAIRLGLLSFSAGTCSPTAELYDGGARGAVYSPPCCLIGPPKARAAMPA